MDEAKGPKEGKANQCLAESPALITNGPQFGLSSVVSKKEKKYKAGSAIGSLNANVEQMKL